MAIPILKRLLVSPPKPLALPFSSTSSDITSIVTSLLTHHRSKSRWTHLLPLLSSLTPSHISQITLHLKSNPHLALRFFLFTHRHSPSSFDLLSFSTITHILSRSRLRTRARSIIRLALSSPHNLPLKFFETLLKSYKECDSAPFVFDLLVKSCLDMKKIDGSLQIVRMLMSRRISLQISTCNMLVSSVSGCNGCYAGYGVFREVFGLGDAEVKRAVGVKPNVLSFNCLMMGFYRDGEIEMVEEIWSEMARFGCIPNAVSYSVLMALFCEEGKMGEVKKLWKEMEVKGIKPDVVAYNTVIGGFCKIGEVEKGEDLLREMELSGVESTCVTLEHLINGYCNVGNVDSAILVYKDLCRKGFRPEASTVDLLIGGLCEKKRVSDALETMKFAMRNVSFSPSEKGYELLIKGLCDDGKMEDALTLQAKMAGQGFQPNSKIYGAFIEGYMKLGNEKMAALLVKEMSEAKKWQQEN